MQKVIVMLSMHTHSPVAYWLDMPILEVMDWLQLCADVLLEQREAMKKE